MVEGVLWSITAKTMIRTEAFCFDMKLRQSSKRWSMEQGCKDSWSYQGTKSCQLGLPGYILQMYLWSVVRVGFGKKHENKPPNHIIFINHNVWNIDHDSFILVPFIHPISSSPTFTSGPPPGQRSKAWGGRNVSTPWNVESKRWIPPGGFGCFRKSRCNKFGDLKIGHQIFSPQKRKWIIFPKPWRISGANILYTCC